VRLRQLLAVSLAPFLAACPSTPVVSLDGDGGGPPDASVSPVDAAIPAADASLDAAADAADAADAAAGDGGQGDAAPDAAVDSGYVCTPACSANGCGPDGCGGSCGTCTGESQCQSGTCAAPTCGQSCGPTEKCGWDPRMKGGIGGFGCIPQGWTTLGCNGVGGLGTCDFDGNLRRCTPTGLVADLCRAGCGLKPDPACNGLTACVVCLNNPVYCLGVESAPICQDGLRVECYDNAYDLRWCADTGTTCQCPGGICTCQ
jgi:hypothetical protein